MFFCGFPFSVFNVGRMYSGCFLFVVSLFLVESEVIGVCEVADVNETES